MKIFKFLFVCTILFSCSKPKIGEIGNYQVALGDVKADFYVLMWEQSFNLKKSKVYTSYSNGALHSTRGVLSGKVLHGDYKEVSSSGTLLKIGTFRKGLKDGYWASYNEDGSLLNDLRYSKGDTVSVVKFYNKDGSVKNTLLPSKRKKRADKREEKCLKREACKAEKKAEKESLKQAEDTGNESDEPTQKNNKFNLSKLKFKFKKSKKDSISDSSPAE
mgnify:FL=1